MGLLLSWQDFGKEILFLPFFFHPNRQHFVCLVSTHFRCPGHEFWTFNKQTRAHLDLMNANIAHAYHGGTCTINSTIHAECILSGDAPSL